MAAISDRSQVISRIGCALFIFHAIGCGNGNTNAPTATGGASAVDASDLPVCGPAGNVNPPTADGTPDPRADVNRTGARLEKYHLAEGASIRDRLFLSLIKDDRDGLLALLNAGGDINSRHGGNYSIDSDGLVLFKEDANSEKQTLLQWAAGLSYSGETIRLLLSRGAVANINIKTAEGRTPLMNAARNEYLAPEGFQALIDAGADVRVRDADKMDAIMHAVSTDNRSHSVLCQISQKLTALIRAGADINGNEVYTPLMAALYNRNLGVAKLVRGLGGDLRARAKLDGSSALHMVARAADDNVETVRWLLDRGIDLRIRDNAHLTALQLFKENLTEGRCHVTDSFRPLVNNCAKGTLAIINLIEHRHKR